MGLFQAPSADIELCLKCQVETANAQDANLIQAGVRSMIGDLTPDDLSRLVVALTESRAAGDDQVATGRKLAARGLPGAWLGQLRPAGQAEWIGLLALAVSTLALVRDLYQQVSDSRSEHELFSLLERLRHKPGPSSAAQAKGDAIVADGEWRRLASSSKIVSYIASPSDFHAWTVVFSLSEHNIRTHHAYGRIAGPLISGSMGRMSVENEFFHLTLDYGGFEHDWTLCHRVSIEVGKRDLFVYVVKCVFSLEYYKPGSGAVREYQGLSAVRLLLDANFEADAIGAPFR
ncbi:hypothetical protein [Actinomycetospora chiangmaiensis]|uniref:hypothetical protein n=1 Tax=Actinomycetospora chiangmaiensis TaxID=402650 RepID=UPI0012F8956A|nr:hypothetical protein [Actinomycetospora chiangmaiensis]